MKLLLNKLSLTLLMTFAISLANGQSESEETGMPGDHFSLHGALEMFKKANTIEEFEKFINEKDNGVNNLDINEDGEVDYITINDNQENEAHAIVLQIAVSDNEMQDIAVIEVEKTGKDQAILQIVGNEDIFGEEIIVEASDGNDEGLDEDHRTKRGPNAYTNISTSYVVVNVWTWPTVRYIYAPTYRPYRSPWHWRHYPTWHKPWRPLALHTFHPFAIKHRHVGFRTVTTHRVTSAHRVYSVHRKSSVTVTKRYASNKSSYKVKQTTRKVKVTGPKGKQTTVKQSKTKGRKGRGK